jgi:tetratricopeptide (TPR) repeat protein
MANNIEGALSFIDGYKLAQAVGNHLSDRQKYTTEEFIEIAEKALKKSPDEWVILYALGTKYLDVGRYVDSVKVLGQSVKQRPKDIRSVYALATAYNMLTRAWWTKEDAENRNTRYGLTGYNKIDPDLAKQELEKAGLTLETSVAQAIRWFERALELNPDNQSKKQIQWDLETLYQRFPKLRH